VHFRVQKIKKPEQVIPCHTWCARNHLFRFFIFLNPILGTQTGPRKQE